MALYYRGRLLVAPWISHLVFVKNFLPALQKLWPPSVSTIWKRSKWLFRPERVTDCLVQAFKPSSRSLAAASLTYCSSQGSTFVVG